MPAGLCTAGTGDALWPENAHATKLREPAHTAETGTPQPGRIAGCESMDIVPVVGCCETYDARGEGANEATRSGVAGLSTGAGGRGLY